MQLSQKKQKYQLGHILGERCLVTCLAFLFATFPTASACALTFGSGIESWGRTTFFERPVFYIGWQTEELGHVAQEFHDRGKRIHGLIHGRYLFRQPGFWIGLSDTVSLGDRFRVGLEGWLMLPGKSDAPSDYADARWGEPGDIPDTGIGRLWEVKNSQGWFLDASVMAGSSLEGIYYGWSPIAGFRYDFYQRRLQQTSAELMPNTGPNDEMDISVKTFVPYFGLQYQREGEKISTTLRLVGSPIIFGNLSHSEDYGIGGFRDEGFFVFDVPRGYWGELFMEISGSPHGRFGLGAFLKMTTMTLQSHSNLTSSYADGRSENADYDLVYRRLIYTFGAKFSLRFSSPL